MYARSSSGNGKFTHLSRLESSLIFVEPDFLGCLASFRVSSLDEPAKFLPTFVVQHRKRGLHFFPLRSGEYRDMSLLASLDDRIDKL